MGELLYTVVIANYVVVLVFLGQVYFMDFGAYHSSAKINVWFEKSNPLWMDGWIYYYHRQHKNNVVAKFSVNTGTNKSNI